MALTECRKCGTSFSVKVGSCPFCNEPNLYHKRNQPKKWYEKNKFKIGTAAFFIIIFLGFIHIISGVRTKLGFHHDFALKKSFGYKETFIDARKIVSIPYVTAKIKYPISCEVLQRLGYLPSDDAFEAQMKDVLVVKFDQWQKEFAILCNLPQQQWYEKLQGQTQDNDGDAESYNNNGITAAKQINYERAISEFSRAIKKAPAFADAYYNRGLVYTALGQRPKAVSDFTKVIEINPAFTDVYIDRGNLYIKNEEYQKAIADFSAVLQLSSKCFEAYFCRCLVYFALGQYDKTWDDVKQIQKAGHQIPAEFHSMLRNMSN